MVYVTGRGGDVYRGVSGQGDSFQSMFAVGSISKTFTAAGIEILVARGRLRYALGRLYYKATMKERALLFIPKMLQSTPASRTA